MVPVPSSDSDESDGHGQMTPHRGNSSFQTTIEVITGTKLVYHLGRSLINSLAATRIDTHAFTACLKIGKALCWSRQGRDRFYEAKKDLRLAAAWEKVLKFGFNWQYPISEVLASEHGERFAALTACLTEVYEPPIVAKIYVAFLEHLVKKNADDVSLQDMSIPSLFQMQSVVARFAGIFSTSNFATSVEDYMSYDNHAVVTGGIQSRKRASRPPTSRTIASPDYIAVALYELLQLSADGSDTQQIQLNGEADAVALAAIGRYLIGLPTAMYKMVDGSIKEVTSPGLPMKGKPRVVVLLSNEHSQSSSTIRLTTQSRVVFLPQMHDIVKGHKLPDPELVLAGRCGWDRLLSLTFQKSFDDLTKMYIQFGIALGSAARVFQALAEGDEALPQQWLVACRTYGSASHGPDYIAFAFARFPEIRKRLKKAEDIMHEKARLPYKEAAQQLEESMSKISMECRCKVCSTQGIPNPRGHTGNPDSQSESKEWYCLTALATTIIRLIRVISCVDFMNEKLCLKRGGIEWLFEQQKSRLKRHRQMAKTHNNAREELYITRILDYVRIDKSAPEFSSLAVVHTLFSGDNRKDELSPYTSATQSHGICSWYHILNEPTRDAGRAARICVIPGFIEFGKNTYSGVQDLGFDPYKDTQKMTKTESRPNKCVSDKAKDLAAKQTAEGIKLYIRQRLDASVIPLLEVGFSLPMPDSIEWLGPAKAVENITQGTGLTYCRPSQCHSPDQVEEELKKILPLGSPTSTAHVTFQYGETQATIFRGDTPTALIAASGCWLPLFLTGSNCVKCAIHTGIKNSWKNFAIVCSENSFVQSESKKLLEAGSEVSL